jgi:excisionase family DNA binding protein
MRTFKSDSSGPAHYTVREAAWLLGVEPATVARAIRVGTLRATWRRGRFVIPADALAALLAEPAEHDERSGDAP